MRKKSKQLWIIPESGSWWEAVWNRLLNGLSRAARNLDKERVGTDGNRTRYKSGVYVCTWESGRFVNLSGTAIIRFLLPSQAADSLWRSFLYIKGICYRINVPLPGRKSSEATGGYHNSWHIREKEESGEFFLTDSKEGIGIYPWDYGSQKYYGLLNKM